MNPFNDPASNCSQPWLHTSPRVPHYADRPHFLQTHTSMDWDTIGASVAASTLSKIVFHPIDTARTLLQTGVPLKGVPIRAYWNGLLPSMALSVPGGTVYLVAYRQTKQYLQPHLGPFSNYVVSGSVAEIASSFIWTPMEVLKGRLQVATTAKRHPWTVVRDIQRQEGFRGFMRGYWMGVAVFLPHSVVFWVVFENVKRRLAQYHPLSWTDGAISAAAGTTVATCSTNVLDVIKTRQQLAWSPEMRGLRPDDKLGVVRIARDLFREKGVLPALTRGLGVRLSASIPAAAFTMAIVEYLDPDEVIDLE